MFWWERAWCVFWFCDFSLQEPNSSLLFPLPYLPAGLQVCIYLTLAFTQKWCHSEIPALGSAHFQVPSFHFFSSQCSSLQDLKMFLSISPHYVHLLEVILPVSYILELPISTPHSYPFWTHLYLSLPLGTGSTHFCWFECLFFYLKVT